MIATAPSSHADFAAALLDPERPVPTGVVTRGSHPPAHRFAIHRNNMVAGLVDALAEAFPVTRALVGTDFFRAMARERVAVDPPDSPLLVEYGTRFPDFIAGFAPAGSVPYLADVARLEQLRIQAYHARDAAPVPADLYEALGADPERLAGTRLLLHPACQWLASRHAVFSIWSAHQGLDDPSHADLSGVDVDAPEAVLVTRPGLDVGVSRLLEGAVELLGALAHGHPLGEALVRAGADVHPGRIEPLLALLVGQQLAIHLDPEA